MAETLIYPELKLEYAPVVVKDTDYINLFPITQFTYAPDGNWPVADSTPNNLATTTIEDAPGDRSPVVTTHHFSGHLQSQIVGRTGSSQKVPWRENWLRGDFGSDADALKWPRGQFTRMRIFVKIDNARWLDGNGYYDPPTDTLTERFSLSIGSYIKPENWSNASADEVAGEIGCSENPARVSGHSYHTYHTAKNGVWQQLILDRQPQTVRNDSPSDGHILLQDYPYPTVSSESPNDNADCGYYDVFRRYYVAFDNYVEPLSSGPVLLHFTTQEFFSDNQSYCTDELEHRVSSLSAQWDAARSVLNIGLSVLWQLNNNEVPYPPGEVNSYKNYKIAIRYSFSTTYVENGWDSATPLHEIPNGISRTGRSKAIDISGFDWGANDVVYLAFAVSWDELEPDPIGTWGWREIVVTKDNSQLPPLPGV